MGADSVWGCVATDCATLAVSATQGIWPSPQARERKASIRLPAAETRRHLTPERSCHPSLARPAKKRDATPRPAKCTTRSAHRLYIECNTLSSFYAAAATVWTAVPWRALLNLLGLGLVLWVFGREGVAEGEVVEHSGGAQREAPRPLVIHVWQGSEKRKIRARYWEPIVAARKRRPTYESTRRGRR